MVHTIAEEQRIMREYNQWEQEYDVYAVLWDWMGW